MEYATTGRVPELEVPVQPEDLRLELPEHAGGATVNRGVLVDDGALAVEVALPENLAWDLSDAMTLEETSPWVIEQGDLIQPDVFPAGQVVAKTTTQAANADGFHVSFDYCLVRFTRPWWDDVFLTRSDWSLPGYRPGQVSSGSASRPAGAITLMTVGMLVVRNLAIRANWSDRDKRAMASSVSLGPFSIAGASFDSASGTVSHDGMQAIAWLCQVPQELPPVA
jgi:hypothetical protein